MIFTIGTGRRGCGRELSSERCFQSGTPGLWAAARAPRRRRRGSHSPPAVLSLVPSVSKEAPVEGRLIGGIELVDGGPSTCSTLRTACRRPCRRSALPRPAVLGFMTPVDAPEGTLATPAVPSESRTSTCTVGLPRESRISRRERFGFSSVEHPLHGSRGSSIISRAMCPAVSAPRCPVFGGRFAVDTRASSRAGRCPSAAFHPVGVGRQLFAQGLEKVSARAAKPAHHCGECDAFQDQVVEQEPRVEGGVAEVHHLAIDGHKSAPLASRFFGLQSPCTRLTARRAERAISAWK